MDKIKKQKKCWLKLKVNGILDDNGNVTYTRIVEAHKLSKEEIYNRALNYFVYNYGSGKSVIQTQDKECRSNCR